MENPKVLGIFLEEFLGSNSLQIKTLLKGLLNTSFALFRHTIYRGNWVECHG